MKKITLFLTSLLLLSCHSGKAPLSLHWEFGRNDVEPFVAEAYLTITNTSSQTLTDGWTLYYCLEAMTPIPDSTAEIDIRQIQGSYHRIVPNLSFAPLPKDSSRTYCIRFRGSAHQENRHPEGFFLVFDADNKPVTIPCTYAPYTRKEQMLRGIDYWEKTPYADGEYVWSYNQDKISGPLSEQVLPLIPQPKEVVYGSTLNDISTAARILQEDSSIPAEGYRIRLTEDTVYIAASSEAGYFYAETTLRQLPSPCTVSFIYDYPDMPHRGVMLDIVRNFYPVDSVLSILEVMAEQKLNVLHFHLSDDEAWRIEMPSLPELTAMASRRGYTLTETECLFPMYCGGWDYTDPHSTANGYLTREQYIRILRFAKERHIRVIPEIDMPGHMRACKKAMHGLLNDSTLDARTYYGAQEYSDNVIAVTKPYALTFIETVVHDFAEMYKEAGCEFAHFNIGGDEVPEGALTEEEHQAFIDGVLDILNRYHLQPMGWEEITHFCKPETQAVCYSWHNGEEKPLEMANAGYPVVLATANHLYFDFAYCRHHEEKGLHWGGFTDEWSSFDWIPLQHPNIIGLNAQMWAETFRSFAQVEWQLYPKIFGLAERAWNNHSALTLADYTRLVYQVEMPHLAATGRNFHIQQPGIHLDNDTIYMNCVMEGGDIYYTLDDHTWQRYTAPFVLPAERPAIIKARVEYLHHRSNTTWRWLD